MQNRILTDKDREKLAPVIDDMFKLVPEMMSRKFERANVQQAFIVNFIYPKYAKKKILCVGRYEDTAYEYLKLKGLDIIGIDPHFDYDLHTFTTIEKGQFDIIFATSVMEHVKDDHEFIVDMCKLLAPKGIGILTVDFLNTYKPKGKKPDEDQRLYTAKDYIRIGKTILDYDCVFVDEFVADAEPDFTYGDITYSFSTMVFKKVK